SPTNLRLRSVFPFQRFEPATTFSVQSFKVGRKRPQSQQEMSPGLCRETAHGQILLESQTRQIKLRPPNILGDIFSGVVYIAYASDRVAESLGFCTGQTP